MANDNQTYCGFENGQDWIDDLAIENYLLNRVEIPKINKGAS